MSSNLATGIIGLTGVVVGGGITAGTQLYAARLARLRAADNERQCYAAALRLMIVEGTRSIERLGRMTENRVGERGYGPLSRTVWMEYRSLLALHLGDDVDSVAEAYKQVIEWNEIVWSAFAKHPPPEFHGANQNDLLMGHAEALLSSRIGEITSALHAADQTLRRALDATRH